MGVGYGYRAINFNPCCYPVSWFIAWIVLAVGHRLRLMYVLIRLALLVFMAGSLSGAEYTPCGCDCNTPAINTQEEENYFYIQHLIYYPEENNTTIIYKI